MKQTQVPCDPGTLEPGDVATDKWGRVAHVVRAVTLDYATVMCGRVLWVEIGYAGTRLARPGDPLCKSCAKANRKDQSA